jgi:hypothetical protein
MRDSISTSAARNPLVAHVGATATSCARSANHTCASGQEATTRPEVWRDGRARLLLAEAFVSRVGTPVSVASGQHATDAIAAGKALTERLDVPGGFVSDVRCSPHQAFNLLASMAIWAGLQIRLGELCEDVLVIHVQPVSVSEQPH